MCLSLTSDPLETIHIISKLNTVFASDMIMHHMLIILTSTFIHGHTDLNRENNKSWIILEDFKQCGDAHHVCCEDIQTKGQYIIFSQSKEQPLFKFTTASQT